MTTEAELLDRAAISDVVIRYATGVDTRDWDLYRTCFTDPVTIDFSSFSGRPETTMPADQWVRQVAATLPGFDGTQHLSTNHVITFDGVDRATCVSQVQALHYIADAEVSTAVIGGHYTNTLVRTPDGWRITRCHLTVRWKTGDQGLFDVARQRVKERATG